MRTSPLHDKLTKTGASFIERNGVQIASSVYDSDKEYGFIRDAVGITDFSFVQKFKIPEETGIDFLDDLFAGNVAKVRFGRASHTFLANDNGDIVADCYIINNDEEFILLCESLIGDDELIDFFDKHGGKDAGLKNITDDFAVISVDGCKAWEVAKDCWGTDVLGLPYLSIESYPYEDAEVHVIRAGKTSEFGYLFMVPTQLSEKLFDSVSESAVKHGGGICGIDIHNDLRLEGRFFNIFAEGSAVKDPLVLGLQWMIDFDKETFIGFDAIMERRKSGLKNKLIGISCDSDVLKPGVKISDGENDVAEVVATCYSRVLNKYLGLAVFPVDIAYSGLDFKIENEDVKTISMPPIMPKSLGIKLDEL